MRKLSLCFLLLFAVGCVGARSSLRLTPDDVELLAEGEDSYQPPLIDDAPVLPVGVRADIVERARSLVGTSSLRQVTRSVTDDCSGFVALVYRDAGIMLGGSVTELWRVLSEKKAVGSDLPQPGDIVFFRETYDRNRDGRRNDGLTHVGIVEESADDGTVVFIHRGSKGVERSRFNVKDPLTHFTSDGRLMNDYLRARSRQLRAYLAGELYAGVASPDPLR